MCVRKIVVEVPCSIGDAVWGITTLKNGVPIAKKGIVGDIIFTRDMSLQIRVHGICRGEWCKKVFATEEEATKAIQEKEQKSY